MLHVYKSGHCNVHFNLLYSLGISGVAQWLEQWNHNPLAGGSNPSSTKFTFSVFLEYKLWVYWDLNPGPSD